MPDQAKDFSLEMSAVMERLDFLFITLSQHNRFISEPEELIGGAAVILHDARKDLHTIHDGLYGQEITK
jgi:hypothetical protein